MISYYHNPKTEDLLVWDPDEKEIFIIEKIKNIRVFTGGDIAMGDTGKERELYHDTKHKKPEKPVKKRGRSNSKGLNKKLSGEITEKIKRMVQAGKKPDEIKEETGISVGSAYKYYKKFHSDFKPMRIGDVE